MTVPVHLLLKCPKCRTEFLTDSIASCGHAGMDTDFRPQYWGMDPLPLFIHRCPRCRFIGESDEFQEQTALFPSQIEFAPRRYLRDPDDAGWDRYVDLARRKQSEGAPKREVGEALLRAAWCARGVDEMRERKLLLRAAEASVRALSEPEAGGDDTAVLTYLVGEVFRRAGHFDKSIAYLEQVEKSRAGPPWLRKAIRIQKRLARSGDASNTSASTWERPTFTLSRRDGLLLALLVVDIALISVFVALRL